MFFSKSSAVLAVAALSSFAVAQESASSTMAMGSSATMSSATASGSVLVHVINAKTVNNKPVFDPPQIMANPGELVQFQFWPMNHSVVQATFKDPCLPISQSSAGNGTQGFFSGFMPVSSSSTQMPTFTIQVNDTKPIWFYCSQARHCQSGMVGVINPTAAKNLTDFASRAALATSNVTPGGDMTSGGSSASSGTAESSGSTTMATMTTGTGKPAATGTGVAAGTNAAPGSAAYVSSAMAVAMAALAASMLLA